MQSGKGGRCLLDRSIKYNWVQDSLRNLEDLSWTYSAFSKRTLWLSLVNYEHILRRISSHQLIIIFVECELMLLQLLFSNRFIDSFLILFKQISLLLIELIICVLLLQSECATLYSTHTRRCVIFCGYLCRILGLRGVIVEPFAAWGRREKVGWTCSIRGICCEVHIKQRAIV